MELTDEELIESFQKGNQTAFTMMFERYKGRLFNFCLRFLANRAEAEDVTSDVFVAFINNRYTSVAQVKFSTWAFTVARNGCIDRLRKGKHVGSTWVQNDQGEMEELSIKDREPLAREKIDQQHVQDQVQLAIQKLPLEQKEAIILREFHDLSYNEIAQVLNCSLENVKILIFRGRERLRLELASFVKGEMS